MTLEWVWLGRERGGCVISMICSTLQYGWTPLHRAAENGHTSVVSYLVDLGADMEAKLVVSVAENLRMIGGSAFVRGGGWRGKSDVWDFRERDAM